MSEFYASEWFLPTVMLAIALCAAAVIALFAVCSGRDEELQAGLAMVLPEQEDFFAPVVEALPDTASEMTPEQVKVRFNALIKATWTEADERRRLLRRRALPNPRSSEGDRDV